MSKQIFPDFTEDAVALMIQSMITVIRFPRAPYSLILFSKQNGELVYGSDAKIESIRPLYLQFKRPFAYPYDSSSGIIKQREKLGLSVYPKALYFNLRKKKVNHFDYQHNILYRLNKRLTKRNIGNAVYVCPLFLERQKYYNSVHLSSLQSWFYVIAGISQWIQYKMSEIISNTGNIRFQNIPVLNEHIVIPPHDLVTTHNHKYSFLETSREICFHSPAIIDQSKNNRFGEFLYELFSYDQRGEIGLNLMPFTDSENELRDIIEMIGIEFNFTGNITEDWKKFGSILFDYFGIAQFMILKYKD